MTLAEGWYLMSTADLERELGRWRGEAAPASNAEPLDVDEALAFRNRGNLPDHLGRTLRLVLRIEDADEMRTIDERRLLYEPDYQARPRWRVEGSRPVNDVPLRSPTVRGTAQAWWEDERMASFEEEWQRTGEVAGIRIPATLRGFVYKTISQLQATGREVTVQAIQDSIARWVAPADAEEIGAALEAAQQGPTADRVRGTDPG